MAENEDPTIVFGPVDEDDDAEGAPGARGVPRRLTAWHRFQDGASWRLVRRGVAIQGRGIPRTDGAPLTATRIWTRFRAEIDAAAARYSVPCVLIVATIATESGGNPNAVRHEPGWVDDAATPDKVSPGLMQTLLSTARATLGDPTIDGPRLLIPEWSIRAGTAFIAGQRGQTGLDPPKVAAAYNAGSVRYEPDPGNPWRMRCYPPGTGAHVTRFTAWFNDAVAVLGAAAPAPAVGFDTLL